MTRLITQIFVCSLAILWASGCVLHSHGGHPVVIIDDDHHDDHHYKDREKEREKHWKHNKKFLKMERKH